MLTSAAIAYFGSRAALTKALGLSAKATYQWGEMVPPLRAAKLHELTGGRVKFDPDAYAGYWKQPNRDKAKPAHKPQASRNGGPRASEKHGRARNGTV